jgi:hypothetical protein
VDAIWAKLSADVSAIKDELDEAWRKSLKHLHEDATLKHKVSQPLPTVVHKTTGFLGDEHCKN